MATKTTKAKATKKNTKKTTAKKVVNKTKAPTKKLVKKPIKKSSTKKMSCSTNANRGNCSKNMNHCSGSICLEKIKNFFKKLFSVK